MEQASTHPKSPRISVLIPCYQQARFLPEALDSVLRQEFQDLEVIASDDASTDNTFSVLQDYAARDSRIHIFHQPSNLGMVANWNFCLRQAQGEAVKLMGGDDRLDRPDCLSRQWQSLQTPGVTLVGCARNIIDQFSCTLETLVNLPSGVFSRDEIIPKLLEHQDNLIGEPVCCLFRRTHATRYFHPEYLQNADIEMWLHILRFGELAYEAEPLVSFRKHSEQESSANIESGLALKEHLLLVLKQASSENIPTATKFHVLWRAEKVLRVTPSMEIQAAAHHLALQLGWKNIFIHTNLHRIRRTLHRWNRSISKRIFK